MSFHRPCGDSDALRSNSVAVARGPSAHHRCACIASNEYRFVHQCPANSQWPTGGARQPTSRHSHLNDSPLMHIDHPYRVDPRGRTAITDDDDYVRDLIELVLFTAPGERVNRP